MVRGLFGQRPVPFDEWDANADKAQLPAVRHLRRLHDEGLATSDGYVLTLGVAELFDLPGQMARDLGLIAPLSLDLALRGRVEAPGGEIRVRWTDADARAVMPERVGLVVRFGATTGRLSAPVYRLLEAVDGYNATIGSAADERIAAWLPVQRALEAVSGATVRADGVLENFRIYQAGAFALDIRQTADGPEFDPVLMAPEMRRPGDGDEPPAPEAGIDPDEELRDGEAHALLPPALRRPFLAGFASGTATRPSYVLQRQTYLVIEPELRAALDVVQRMRTADAATRREFVRNPRNYLAAASGTGADVGSLFVETQQYSERVQGLGLWVKPKLEWLARKTNGWLPERFLVRIGEQAVEISPAHLEELGEVLQTAQERQSDTLTYAGHTFETAAVADMLERLARPDAPPPPPRGSGVDQLDLPERGDPAPRQVLVIADNLLETGFVASSGRRRHAAPKLFPSDYVLTAPKEHQIEGFSWLVDAWISGLPGVLLADDMGLGKTMQALAFLTWFLENRRAAGRGASGLGGPILVVAPTALLRNWQKEAARHLTPRALGPALEAFGPRLAHLKTAGAASPEEALDLEEIKKATWVLTTYETLANYHRAFARVAFPVAVFDEIQKIKAPDTINSHAAKTMNADFVLGMTGTPVENRIQDLWSIMDRVAPGRFGTLKGFSEAYGTEDPDALAALKARLDQGQDGLPPLMLRRMKEDHIQGLPERTIRPYAEVPMPPPQAQAYSAAVAGARRGAVRKGWMLQVIHQLRGISLHPFGAEPLTGDTAARQAWISASARVVQALRILDDIRAKGEKALVFIEDRQVQAAFASVVADHFGVGEPPIINGSVPGERRQAIVDRFQDSPPGFGILILSPKAAGMGLTITAANHVIHLSRWWNPAVEDQCNDRVFRLGQTRPVTVHIPMAIHPELGDTSFDRKLDELIERKRLLSRSMLVPPVSDSDAAGLFDETVVRA